MKTKIDFPELNQNAILSSSSLNHIKGGDTTALTEAERLAQEAAARIAKVGGKSITIELSPNNFNLSRTRT